MITGALMVGMVGCQPAPVPQYNLTISSTAGGSVVTPGEGTFTYDAGTVVSLLANADEEYQFAGWVGDVGSVSDGSSASTTVTVDRNYSINASFAMEIRDWHELHAIRDSPRDSYILMNNLDSATAGYGELAGPTANDGKGWEPIGTPDPFQPFTGSFDGQGYEISDLFVARPDEDGVGLFGLADEGGVIKNTAVVGANVTGGVGVGGLVGYHWGGTVANSHASGNMTGDELVGGLVGTNADATIISSCSSGSVIGYLYVGGLVGTNDEGTIINCCSSSNVAGEDGVGGLVGENHEGTIESSCATGSVTGSWFLGGLVGENHEGTIENSYATGSVVGTWFVGGLVGYNDGSVDSCYAAGSVNGGEYVGGLAGQNGWQGTVSNSFWDTVTSGIEESAGGTGKTTAEMEAIATFTDTETEGLDEPWDIVAVAPGETDEAYVWNIIDGETYPFLRWRSSS